VELEPSDGALIAASAEDPALFGTVFERHFAHVHRYLARRVGPAIADDLAAETFVTAFRLRDRFDPAAFDARPWLFGIAVNGLRRHWRAERRQLRAYARTGVDPLGDELAEAERRVDAGAARSQLARGLLSLSHGDREALLLFAWAELSYEEVAVALAIPVGTVRSRLWRARTRMQAVLAPVASESPRSRVREPHQVDGRMEIETATEGGRSG
jgi:RNA polymerase sigma-70 factor (ECF subfamily)